ncbi:MAG TPA: monofunctional biosynthetic peptidoglycan transglycosylase [Burkholderiales bacterium]|nr:monofunctional biosynthetic peptidoglycan transglycosylase [Burkholderiales bacterium]
MARLLARLLGRVLLLAAGALVVYQFWLFGHVVYWMWFNPTTTAFMDARLEALRKKNPRAELQHKWVSYDHISVNLKRALVAAEDAKFLDHSGFDWEAIQEAAEKNLRRGKVVAGGSTISQQLAKNLLLSGQRTPWRKIEEAAITVMIETVMSKRRILEIYLNVIEWGDDVFGAEAAARHYFYVGADALTADEAARLAAMVPKPRFYERVGSTPLLEQRASTIFARMDEVQVP